MKIPTKTTAVPNAVFDYWLPRLKPSALCILLIIIRQTLGRSLSSKNSDERKESDWISGSQLRLRCNYSRKTISSAVEALVNRKLILVCDEYGNELNNPHSRQGKPKLLFKLTDHSLLSVLPVDKRWRKGVDRYNSVEKQNRELRKNVLQLAEKLRITK